MSSDRLILGLTKRIVVVDAETCSKVDLKKYGAARYWADKSTRVLMLSFKEHISKQCYLWQPHLNDTPKFITEIAALPPEECLIAAFNAAFDAEAMAKLGLPLPKEKYLDIAMLCYALSFAGKLDQCLAQFDVKDEYGRPLRKNTDGALLMTKFSKRQTPWYDDPAGWSRYCQYCIDDSQVEVELLKKCLAVLDNPVFHPQMVTLQRQWLLNQRINARGIPVSLKTLRGAEKIKRGEIKRLLDRTRAITGVANPNSPEQVKAWSESRGYPLVDMKAENIREAIDDPEMPEDVKQVLRMRMLAGKASVKKIDSMLATQVNGRLHNAYTLLGASRTGRDASRGINLANLERPKFKTTGWVADVLDLGDVGMLPLMLDGKEAKMEVMEVLGSCVRAMIKAPEDRVLTVADLKSIESVGIGWLAGCQTILDIFHQGRDSYREYGTRYYNIPYDQITDEQRTMCKPAVLSCVVGETEVLTRTGWVEIASLPPCEQVWDGVEFVSHGGVVFQGEKLVILKYGVGATYDHQVMPVDGGAWCAWSDFRLPGMIPGVGLRDRRETYDILNCGPRSRFVIKTSFGTLLAHNCGFGGSHLALLRSAKSFGLNIPDADAKRMVDIFRKGYREIPLLWSNLENAAKDAVRNKGQQFTVFACDRFSEYGKKFHTYKPWPCVTFFYDGTFLMMGIPSGRTIFYYRPQIMQTQVKSKKKGANGEDTYWTADSLFYWGKKQDDGGAWCLISTHGGMIAENLTQAVCRDVMFHGLEIADKDPGMEVIGSTYDEIITLTKKEDRGAYDRLLGYMTTKPPFVDDNFFLGADGYTGVKRYKK